MEFRTEIKSDKSPYAIGVKDGFVTIGSCFSDAIGHRLSENKFEGLVNPTGTIYNPISIHNLLLMAIKGTAPRLDGYCSREQSFLHHDFHSVFFDSNQEALALKLKNLLAQLHKAIKSCRVLFITYGTAWVFEHRIAQQIVANCHKVPQVQFNKFLLTQKRALESFEEMMQLLLTINPNIRVVLTVSPVRHIKDTLPLNQVSKSILRLMCHTLTQQYPQVSYFPAYEIMMDDLRDYRFYDPDLIHPSPVAIDYIWQKFSESYFDDSTRALLTRWTKIKTALNHKAFNPASESHTQFLRNLEQELSALCDTIDVTAELAYVHQQLKAK